MDIKDYMNKLLHDLDRENFKLQYYESFSTDSCYIKLDYGVANSIRISDHKGKNKYPYKFNLMFNLKKSYESKGRKYYCISDYQKLIDDVNKFKEEQLNRFGFHYFEYMLKNKKEGENKNGFWSKAKDYN